MAPKRPKEDLEKVTINLRAGDARFLNEHIPDAGGYSTVIRRLVAAWVDKVKAEKAEKGIVEEPINV